MNKYQKLSLDDSREFNFMTKEKALLDRHYIFPSVGSLTNLNSTKNPYSDSYLNVISPGKSLQHIDSSHILDMSIAKSKLPHSSVNMSHMKSIVLNKKLARKEKSNFEEDQKRIFNSHLDYISQQTQVLDKVKNSLPTLQAELLREKYNGSFLPPIQPISSSMTNIPSRKSYMNNVFLSPNRQSGIKNSNQFQSKSVQPSSRKSVNDGTTKQKAQQDDIFESIMRQLSTKKKAVLNTKESDNSSMISPSNRNDQSTISMHIKEEDTHATKKNPTQILHISDLVKVSDQNTTHTKPGDTLFNLAKNLSFHNSPKGIHINGFDSPGGQVRRSFRHGKRNQLFHEYEDLYQNGKLGSNIEDKFNFFKKTPVGSIITISKKSLNLKDLQSPAQKIQESAGYNSKVIKTENPQGNSMSQYFSQFSQAQTKREEEFKNKQTQSNSKIPAIIQSNNQYLDILKKQAQIQKISKQQQDKKFCQMSKRMSNFFQDQDNFITWERYVLLCRDFKRFIDVLFKIERNLNKNMTYLIRLTGTKKYLINEIIDQQFNLIHFGVIETLENTLISENTLKAYFKVDQDLKSIITEYYIKDLSYINGQFEVYLNNQQIVQSSKVSEIIQSEYKMIKQKEKDLIYDQYDHTGIKNLNIKKSYQFFNDYLYNIQPRRNTYKEIQEFEKNFGNFQYISQIDRDMFQNLEKSYNKIRQSNKQ